MDDRFTDIPWILWENTKLDVSWFMILTDKLIYLQVLENLRYKMMKEDVF